MYLDFCMTNKRQFLFLCAIIIHTLLLLVSSANSESDIKHRHNATLHHRHKANFVAETTVADVAAAAAITATTGGPSSHSSALSSSAATSSSLTNNVKCGNTQKMVDNCFRDLPTHLVEFLQTSKIAINEQEIESKCNVFRRGMKCFDEYTARCIPQHNVDILNNNVEGARRFFTKFCDDATFQDHYLTHKECFTYIQDDWFHCNKHFQNILSEGMHSTTNVTTKFMEFCCARYAYETCIFNSARYKCYANSAAFARDTAKMLSDEKHFSNCRQYESSMCNRSADKGCHCHWVLWLAALLWLRCSTMTTMTTISHKWRRPATMTMADGHDGN